MLFYKQAKTLGKNVTTRFCLESIFLTSTTFLTVLYAIAETYVCNKIKNTVLALPVSNNPLIVVKEMTVWDREG